MGYSKEATKNECRNFNREIIPALDKLGDDRFYDLFFQEILYYDEKKYRLVNKFWCMNERIKEGLANREEFWGVVSKYYEGNDAGVLIEYMIKFGRDIEFKKPEALRKALYGYLATSDFNDESQTANYLKIKLGIAEVDPVDVFSWMYEVETRKLEEILDSYGVSENDEKIDFLRVYFVDPRFSPRGKLDFESARKILHERNLIKGEYVNLIHVNATGVDYILSEDLRFKEINLIHEDNEAIIYEMDYNTYINGVKASKFSSETYDRRRYTLYTSGVKYCLEVDGEFHRVRGIESDSAAAFIFDGKLYFIQNEFIRHVDSGNLELIGFTRKNEIVYLKHKKKKTVLRIYYPREKSYTVDKWKDERKVWIERKEYDDWIGIKGNDEGYYITRDGKLEMKPEAKDKIGIKRTITKPVIKKEKK